ncbi:MAG: hypothetical protein D6727_05230 [Gammaproteobacteria bacterium]|nr:MAG: hypothetical protein D6727_05230 [Gammaproteobacteria bacterium]
MGWALLTASLGTSTASAGGPEDCAAIDWRPDILQRFVDIDRACQGIVERDGRRYVRFTVEFVRRHNNGDVEVLMELRDGKPVKRIFHAPSDFSVDSPTGLSDFKFAELERGEVLDVFIALDRVTAPAAQTTATAEPAT